MKKIISIVGARPQFIKAALLTKGLREHNFEEQLVHTGQHYDFNMSDAFFMELGLPEPNHHLGIGSGNHGEQTGKMLIAIEKIFLQESPDMVLVYGDTNSTLAGALAAAKLHIPIAHVEAGLRSYNRLMPEEINRVVTDSLSSVLFCPTEGAVKNLEKEGFLNTVDDGRLVNKDCALPLSGNKGPLIINVGDVMFDIANQFRKKIDPTNCLKKYGLKSKKYVLVTIHRAENTDNKENLINIWQALREIADSGMDIFFPVHPRTLKVLKTLNSYTQKVSENLRLSEPIPYREMIALEDNAKVIITDSGGVQKEGYFFRTPCVVARGETEWVELIEGGWNVLVGTDKDKIVGEVLSLTGENVDKDWHNFYGEGDAVIKIVNILGQIVR